MKIDKKLIILCFFLVVVGNCFSTLKAQSIDVYPDFFGSTQQTLSLLNPVYLGLNSFRGFKVGSKNNTGQFNDIRSFYGQVVFPIKTKSSEHYIGIDVISEQEGPVIRKNRFRINYVLEKKINENISLSLGTHLGVASFGYKSNKSTAQGTGIGPDGSLGLLIKYKKWNIGLNANQIFSQRFQPKNVSFRYPIYYGFYLDKTWSFVDSELKTFFFTQAFKTSENQYLIGINYEYMQRLGLGFTYQYNRYFSPLLYLKIQDFLSENNDLKVFFTYNYPLQELKSSKITSIEVGLIYNLHKKAY